MLKFFRRIRQKLIDEGNLKRYLLYAIGEILLVMIGILLALQVNNLNTKKQENKEFQTILNSIERDINLDIDFLKLMHAIGSQKYHYWSTLIEKRHIDSLADNIILELGEPRIPLNNAGYISAISDNKLKLISNKMLKSNIVSYYNNELKHWEAQVETMANIHHLIMEQTFEKTYEVKIKDNFAERVEVLLTDASFQELIHSFTRMSKLVRDLAENRLANAEQILEKIKAEKEK